MFGLESVRAIAVVTVVSRCWGGGHGRPEVEKSRREKGGGAGGEKKKRKERKVKKQAKEVKEAKEASSPSSSNDRGASALQVPIVLPTANLLSRCLY